MHLPLYFRGNAASPLLCFASSIVPAFQPAQYYCLYMPKDGGRLGTFRSPDHAYLTSTIYRSAVRTAAVPARPCVCKGFVCFFYFLRGTGCTAVHSIARSLCFRVRCSCLHASSPPLSRCFSTAEAPAAMKLNFCLPHETIYKDKEVDQVIVCAAQQESFGSVVDYVE